LSIRCSLPTLGCAVILHGGDAEAVSEDGQLLFLHSDHPEDENSFDNPMKVGGYLRVLMLQVRCGVPLTVGGWLGLGPAAPWTWHLLQQP
jgi:hypothetical protein